MGGEVATRLRFRAVYREIPQPGPHIACVWTRDPEPEARTRRIVPDACVDIVWTGRRLVVAGPATGPKIARTPPGTSAFGVRFRVGAAGAALGLPASELLDLTVPLDDVWPQHAPRLEAAAHAGPAALAATVAAQLDREPDAAVRAAATGLDVGLGARQLRRRFGDAVGYGPKTLERILRFQRFLVLAATEPSLARLAFDAGYADQAHLTRECTRLSGLPPAALLESGAGPAGDATVSFKTAGPLPATMAA
jgi:AraC-like DNA-binding protein